MGDIRFMLELRACVGFACRLGLVSSSSKPTPNASYMLPRASQQAYKDSSRGYKSTPPLPIPSTPSYQSGPPHPSYPFRHVLSCPSRPVHRIRPVCPILSCPRLAASQACVFLCPLRDLSGKMEKKPKGMLLVTSGILS